jgi:hypothetical protein
MTHPADFERRTMRRSAPRGLIIEGAARSNRRPSGVADVAPAPLTDLAARADTRPYQSLLDDAVRLARRCGPDAASLLRALPSS